jgi:glyoxylase-like metal-dependent hydrolase (beta-lactamase superfamily II)
MEIATLVVGAFEVNCFVAWGASREALVIDPGANAEDILGCLKDNRLKAAAYLLTHGHMDHVSAVADLQQEAPAPVLMHPEDLAWTFSQANQMPPFYPQPRRPAEPIRLLEADMKCAEAGLPFEVLWTPGHTPGSVCFYFKEHNVLFSGDTLFAGSVGRTDLPGGDSRTLTRSLAKLVQLPDDTRVCTGHGPETTIRQERKTNYFLQGR